MFKIGDRRARALYRRFKSSGLRFEALERRELLTGSPPTVVDVTVSSTAWTSSFIDYLQGSSSGAEGYSIPTGSSAQSLPLPWTNIDQISITFSEDVNIDAADLALSGVNTTFYDVASFYYDAASHAATWTLGDYLAADRLMIDLDADGLDPIVDLDGNVLDGEWVTNVTSGASGNGVPGGDFEFEFAVLPGDVNQSQLVNNHDISATYARSGQSVNDSFYSALCDVDGSGLIDGTDWHAVLDMLGNSLPAGQPLGVTNDAPTTLGFALVDLDNSAVDVAISLYDAFGDLEDEVNQLSYEIIENTAPSLLDTLFINSTTGELVMSGTTGATGRTSVTVRATDSNGLSVEAQVTVDVNRDNVAPQIYDYSYGELSNNIWNFSGYVMDQDDDVVGLIVTFSGVFDRRVTVDDNGHFEIEIDLTGFDSGNEKVVAEDPHDLQSEPEEHWVGLT